MDLTSSINNLRRILEDDDPDASFILKRIKMNFPKDEDFKFISHKDLILEQAKESVSTKFRLLATMNGSISIFNWCNVQYNFVGMNNEARHMSEIKDYTVEYTLEELPDVIDSAESWLKSLKESRSHSGSPYMISALQLMGVGRNKTIE